MKTIQQLRKEGYKVRVMHGRITGKSGAISPRGGTTVIELTTPQGTTVIAKAECSYKDNFNRRVGNQIALGRAINMIETNI
jgi:hypothetical protein